MRTKPLSRRAMLRGAGGIGIGLPLLQAMQARGAAATGPKRFVIFYTPNGTNNRGQFTPSGLGTTFKLGAETAPLEPHRNDLLIISGLNMSSTAGEGGDLHSVGMAHMLTGRRFVRADAAARPGGSAFYVGFGGGISIDQHIAKQVGKTRFPSLEFGVQCSKQYGSHPFTRMSYAGANRPVPPEEDPKAMFKRMFSAGTGDIGGVPTADSSSTIDQLQVQRRSVLDFVLDDYKRLGATLGGQDRAKLDDHQSSLRELEKRITSFAPTQSGAGAVACNTTRATPLVPDHQVSSAFPEVGRQQMDLLRLALACDVTRVASLQWSYARSLISHPWANVAGSHHAMSHGGASTQLSTINEWYTRQLASLLTALKATKEGDRSLLDNTVVLFFSEVAFGSDHSFRDIRVTLAGSCGGAFQTGRHISLAGQSHNKLFVTIAQAMGIDSQEFGDPKFGTGPLNLA